MNSTSSAPGVVWTEADSNIIRGSNQNNQSNKFVNINIIVLWIVYKTKNFQNEIEGVGFLELFE